MLYLQIKNAQSDNLLNFLIIPLYPQLYISYLTIKIFKILNKSDVKAYHSCFDHESKSFMPWRRLFSILTGNSDLFICLIMSFKTDTFLSIKASKKTHS